LCAERRLIPLDTDAEGGILKCLAHCVSSLSPSGEQQVNSMAGKIVIRHKGEGDAFWMPGGLYEVKRRAPKLMTG
jgi:hypothetical protein